MQGHRREVGYRSVSAGRSVGSPRHNWGGLPIVDPQQKNQQDFDRFLRDVGVAGSNPVTPTIDFTDYLTSSHSLGVSLKSALVQIWCKFRRISTNNAFWRPSVGCSPQTTHRLLVRSFPSRIKGCGGARFMRLGIRNQRAPYTELTQINTASASTDRTAIALSIQFSLIAHALAQDQPL